MGTLICFLYVLSFGSIFRSFNPCDEDNSRRETRNEMGGEIAISNNLYNIIIKSNISYVIANPATIFIDADASKNGD